MQYNTIQYDIMQAVWGVAAHDSALQRLASVGDERALLPRLPRYKGDIIYTYIHIYTYILLWRLRGSVYIVRLRGRAGGRAGGGTFLSSPPLFATVFVVF